MFFFQLFSKLTYIVIVAREYY